MKIVFVKFGIDILVFKGYSIRVVFIFVVEVCKVFLFIIMDNVGWLNVIIFGKFYKKFIVLESKVYG